MLEKKLVNLIIHLFRLKKNQFMQIMIFLVRIVSEKNIIIMDDEKSVLEDLVNNIKDNDSNIFDDFQLHTTENPESAIKKVENLINDGEEVYVLIADFSLPSKDNSIYTNGLDLIRETRRRFPKIRTLILSNEDDQDIIINAFKQNLLTDHWVKESGSYQKTFIPKLINCIEEYESIFRRTKITMIGKNLLVTGVTGFVGGRLIRKLLERTDVNLYLLGRSKGGTKFDDRVGILNDRVRYIEGDLANPNVVEDDTDLKLLTENIEEVWHLAASTDFDVKLRAETMRINLLGTTNLISLAKNCKKLNCFNYISTAYISGEIHYPQEVYETLPLPSGFKNPYEESKYFAECVVRNSGLPYRIFRPSMIVGDSETGECDAKTIYGAAAMLYISKVRYSKGQDVFTILGDKSTKKNIIPINSVIDMMIKIREADKGLNETFALVNPNSVTVGEILDKIADLQRIKIKFDPTLDESKVKNLGDAFLYRALRQFRAYMTISDPTFVMDNTIRVLPGYHIPEPSPELLEFYFKKFYKETLPKILR